MIESLAGLSTSVGLGLGAGVNAYATFLVFGLLSRFYPGLFTGELADFFATTPVLIVLAVLYAIEFAADKVPMIDHAWDAVHTFIRPLAGGVVALASIAPDMPVGWKVMAGLLGGGAALGGHLTKASVRTASTATTGGAGNPVLSVGEDLWVVAQSLLAVFLPFVFAALAVFVLLPAMVLLFLMFRRRMSGAQA